MVHCQMLEARTKKGVWAQKDNEKNNDLEVGPSRTSSDGE
jgi:hypothetical protein